MFYAFKGGNDGWGPYYGGLFQHSDNFYGTTAFGGGTGCQGGYGCGTVFKVSPNGKETVLLDFNGDEGGANPYAGVIADSAGNLYGTTYEGGASNYGLVFKVTPHGRETVLHSFTDGSDGAHPWSALITDSASNLYGTAWWGGTTSCGFAGKGCGTVFKLKE